MNLIRDFVWGITMNILPQLYFCVVWSMKTECEQISSWLRAMPLRSRSHAQAWLKFVKRLHASIHIEVYCVAGTESATFKANLAITMTHIHFRNECLFFWVHRGKIQNTGQTNRVNCEAVLRGFVCFMLRFIPLWTQKKRHSFLFIYNASNK